MTILFETVATRNLSAEGSNLAFLRRSNTACPVEVRRNFLEGDGSCFKGLPVNFYAYQTAHRRLIWKYLFQFWRSRPPRSADLTPRTGRIRTGDFSEWSRR